MRSKDDPHAITFLIDEEGPDPRSGRVRADLPSIVSNGGMAAVALNAGPFFVTPSAILLFFVTTRAALLLRPRLGHPRLLIHGHFKHCPRFQPTLHLFGTINR